MTPDLTVVMPCRDGERFIADTIVHVLTLAAEAGVTVDLIVVDDGSTDATSAIAGEHPVRLVVQDPRGVAAACNAGIAVAHAPVIGLLDVDDRWTPALFDGLLPAFRTELSTPIVQGRIRDHWPEVGLGPAYEGLNLGSALFAADVFERVGRFDESLPRMSDYDWFVRAYDLRVEKRRVDDLVLHYLRRPDGLVGSTPSPDPLPVRIHRNILQRRQRDGERPMPTAFPSIADYLGVVPPEAVRRPEGQAAGTLRRCDERAFDANVGVRAFACVRDEVVRLPAMLDHHRRLGVGAFFFVDNGSTDGTVELLLGQPDVHLWSADGSFAAAHCGTDWILELMLDHANGGWCLVIDADELFVYPGYEHTAIDELTAALDAEGANALLTLVIDLYSDRSIADTAYEQGDDPLAVCSWFDRHPWTHTQDSFVYPASHPSYFGGARQRVFGTPSGVDPDTYYTQQAIRLFRHDPALQPSSNFHWIDDVRISRGRAAVLHWKYVASFATYVHDEVVRGEHWGGASQYHRYVQGIDRNPALSLFDPLHSVNYVDSAQLVELGILVDARVEHDRSA